MTADNEGDDTDSSDGTTTFRLSGLRIGVSAAANAKDGSTKDGGMSSISGKTPLGLDSLKTGFAVAADPKADGMKGKNTDIKTVDPNLTSNSGDFYNSTSKTTGMDMW